MLIGNMWGHSDRKKVVQVVHFLGLPWRAGSRKKNNCPLRFYLGLNLSTRLCKSNFDYFATKCYGHTYSGQLSILCPFHEQLSMKWTIAIQLSILWEMYIVKTIVHSIDRLLSTDYLSTCLSRCFWPKLSTRFGFVQEDSSQSYRLSRTLVHWGLVGQEVA